MLGELMKNPTLANTFKLLAAHGKKGFYEVMNKIYVFLVH
jgi:gamma-glutamyltranspeptidase